MISVRRVRKIRSKCQSPVRGPGNVRREVYARDRIAIKPWPEPEGLCGRNQETNCWDKNELPGVSVFRDLEWYGACLRATHGFGTRRGIHFDVEILNLYIDALISMQSLSRSYFYYYKHYNFIVILRFYTRVVQDLVRSAIVIRQCEISIHPVNPSV